MARLGGSSQIERIAIGCGVGLILLACSRCSPAPQEASRRSIGAFTQTDKDLDAERCLGLANDVPGYEVQIKNQMTRWCFPCHDENGVQKQLPFLSTYEQVKAAAVASKRTIEAGTMPRPPQVMPNEDRALFVAWVAAQTPAKDGGAVSPDPTSAPSAAAPSAPAPAKKTLKSKCGNQDKAAPATDSSSSPKSSDATSTPPGTTNQTSAPATQNSVTYAAVIGPYVDAKCAVCHRPGATPPVIADYNTTKANSARSLIRIKANTMPPLGGNSAKEIADFDAWVQSGMPP